MFLTKKINLNFNEKKANEKHIWKTENPNDQNNFYSVFENIWNSMCVYIYIYIDTIYWKFIQELENMFMSFWKNIHFWGIHLD